MIVTIDRNEMNAARYACSLCGYKPNFYTIEKNENMVQLEILDEEGKEPTLTMAWHLARQIELKLTCDAFTKK